jgi:peroxiredoxin
MYKFFFVSVFIFVSILKTTLFGQSSIDFTVETINGEEIHFADLNKKGPTLITFWALWCKPCRAELKHLELIYRKFSDKGFSILAINQDSPRSVSKVKSYISSHGLTFPVATDLNQELFQVFNGQSIPLTILFDKNGEVNSRHIGYLPGDEKLLENKIKKLLGITD